MVEGVGFDPAEIRIGPLPQCFLADALHLLYRSEEVFDILGSGQGREVSADHDAVKAVVDKAN